MTTRRKFLITLSGLFLSAGLVGTITLDKKNAKKESNQFKVNNVNKSEIISVIYPNSDSAVSSLKAEIKESEFLKSKDLTSFKNEILVAFKSNNNEDFVGFVHEKVRSDFASLRILSLNGWVFSEFECLLWLAFG